MMNTLQKITTLSCVILLSAFSLVAAININDNDEDNATAWEIDRAHSAINFTISHFFTPVDGTFTDYDATVHFDPENLEESSIDITIPVSSVNTRNQRRDGHLLSEDFFNAEKWPNIHFVSNTIESLGDNKFVAKGEMTIRDVTKEFELPFTLAGSMDHPMQENTIVAGITAQTELMRTDFGVGVGDWAATAVVGDEVDIQLNLELNTSK
ncbi:MAG: YceI family protein [Balneolaceae bacterium]